MVNPTAERGAWNSKIGFLLASIGAAVGLGNLVLFPYRTATNGGATFVLVYIGMMVVVGIPALLAEMAIGRRFRLNPYGAYREAGKTMGIRNAGWIGIIAIATSMLLLSYYTVIAGWAIDFFLKGFTGTYFSDPVGYFGSEVSQGPYTLLLHLIVTGATVAIVAPGVAKGIERTITIMLPVLFVALIGITLFGLFGSGTADGLSFYLKPRFGEFTTASLVDAAGQTFFSIGIGFGLMVVYASYMDRESDIVKDAGTISVADFGIALLGGLMIFPLVFTYGLEGQLSASSIGMLFQVVPQAFAQMGAIGNAVAVVFFLALLFAAISSSIALLETAVATLIDQFGFARWKAALLVGLTSYTIGIISALSINGLSRVDVLMGNIFLIISGISLSLFAGWFYPSLADDINTGARWKVGNFTVWMLRIVVPLVLIVSSVLGAESTCQGLFFDGAGTAWSGCDALAVDIGI